MKQLQEETIMNGDFYLLETSLSQSNFIILDLNSCFSNFFSWNLIALEPGMKGM